MATKTKTRVRATAKEAERTAEQMQRTARQAERTAEQAERALQRLATDAGYAALGAADATIAGVKRVARVSTDVRPSTLWRRFELLSERGRDLVERVRRSDDVQRAATDVREARDRVAQAGESVADALDAPLTAAEGAAEEVGRRGEIDLTKQELAERSVSELRQLAADQDITGRSKMGKDDLVDALA